MSFTHSRFTVSDFKLRNTLNALLLYACVERSLSASLMQVYKIERLKLLGKNRLKPDRDRKKAEAKRRLVTLRPRVKSSQFSRFADCP